MTIEKTLNGTELTVTLTGRLDTTTAPQLEAEFKQNIGGVEKLILDFASLAYRLDHGQTGTTPPSQPSRAHALKTDMTDFT